MAKSITESLPPSVKHWFARAVVGMITADGVVTENELAYLRETIGFLESKDEINKIVDMVKHKERPTLETLKTDPKVATKMLMHLATIAITDDKISQSEIDYFRYVGKKMGFDPRFSSDVIEWGKAYIQLNNRKKMLMRKAAEFNYTS